MDKRSQKKSQEELQQFLHYRKRAFAVPSKKGKGAYDRKKEKENARKLEY